GLELADHRCACLARLKVGWPCSRMNFLRQQTQHAFPKVVPVNRHLSPGHAGRTAGGKPAAPPSDRSWRSSSDRYRSRRPARFAAGIRSVLFPKELSMKIEIARELVRTALAEARRLQLAPLAVTVLDAGGNLVCFEREDGAGLARFDISF